MATILGGGNRAYTALSMAAPDVSVAQYCQQLASNWARQTTQLADHLKQSTAAFFQNWNYDSMLRAAQAATGMITHGWRPDIPYHLSSLSALQNAPNCMIPHVMVHPGLHSLYQQGRIDGYENRYVNPDPDVKHEWHMDWQHLMDGVWVKTPDGIAPQQYLSTVNMDREQETPQAVFAALRTFNEIDRILAASEDDPTSRWNNQRG